MKWLKAALGYGLKNFYSLFKITFKGETLESRPTKLQMVLCFFLARNIHFVEPRIESPLECSRAELSPEKLNAWFCNSGEFLVSKYLIDKSSLIWNADELGFSMDG